jgi:hypothetical protein
MLGTSLPCRLPRSSSMPSTTSTSVAAAGRLLGRLLIEVRQAGAPKVRGGQRLLDDRAELVGDLFDVGVGVRLACLGASNEEGYNVGLGRLVRGHEGGHERRLARSPFAADPQVGVVPGAERVESASSASRCTRSPGARSRTVAM